MTRKQALAGILSRWPGLPQECVKIEISAKLRGPRKILVQQVELWVFNHHIDDLDSVYGYGDNIPDAFTHLISQGTDVFSIELAYIKRKEAQDAAQ